MEKKPIPFWKQKSLEEMSKVEWESLCDGCARCCQVKLENIDDGEIYYTELVCQYLDLETCQCTQYESRSQLVPTCVSMKPEDVRTIKWMPDTCAYRLLAEGKDLPKWHPLVTGSQDCVISAKVSVYGKVIHEHNVSEEEWEHYVTEKHQ